MKRLLWPLAVVIVSAILGAAGLLVAHAGPPAPAASPNKIATLRPTASPSPVPIITNTASGRPRATGASRQTARPRPQLTDPWAVVSAYYRDVDSHKYAKAWALINSGLATGQTYQQFVAGYACTGTEQPTKLDQSGDQVSFNLTVVNDCTGTAQHYTGTDTIRAGKIVAADVTPPANPRQNPGDTARAAARDRGCQGSRARPSAAGRRAAGPAARSSISGT